MDKEIIVPGEAKNERLDKFLSKTESSLSRTYINKLINKGEVLVNGHIKKPSYQLKGGEIIFLKLAEPKEVLKPYEFEVKIIYEDEDIIVVDKPQGIVVHPPQAIQYKTLVNALIFMKKKLSTINQLRAGVVHRLDRETSGVMVLAKNNSSHLSLLEQFRERKVEKEYRAICWGVIKRDRFRIDLPLARDRRNRLKMKISFIKSKEALTEVYVLQRCPDSTFLSIRPLTGRMHQIRVHLKFLGNPIVGDKKYGIKDNYEALLLHAYELGFLHPTRGEFVKFTSPLPERFELFMKERLCTQ